MTGRNFLIKHARRVGLVNVATSVILIALALGTIRRPVVFWVGAILVQAEV